MKFTAHMARIVLCKNCKFSDEIYYHYRDNKFFLKNYFYWCTLYIMH